MAYAPDHPGQMAADAATAAESPAPPADLGAMPAGADMMMPAPRAAKSPAAGAGDDEPLASKHEASSDANAPLLIYEGTLGLMIPKGDIARSMDEVIDVAESVGGHLAGRTERAVQVRVPSAQFRLAMVELAKLGEVTQRAVSAQDVTEEFHDLEVRLENLRATRDRLEKFMAKAKNMQEMLTVEKELERVAQQIDQISGRLRFLRTRAAFSLVTVSFSPKPETPKTIAEPPAPPPPPRGVSLPVDWLNQVGLSNLMHLD